jgi:hypothetical protein
VAHRNCDETDGMSVLSDESYRKNVRMKSYGKLKPRFCGLWGKPGAKDQFHNRFGAANQDQVPERKKQMPRAARNGTFYVLPPIVRPRSGALR